jgi:hypothetical protein
MKTNIKALQLVEKGLSSKTISNLTESQIDILHKKMIGEQATNPKIAAKIKDLDLLNQKVGEVGAKMKNIGLEEDDDFDLDADQAYTGQQGSHDEYQASDDGMDDDTSPENHDSNMIGMSEGKKKSKKDKDNPWAICTTQLGKEFGTRERHLWSAKENNKYERCVKDVKKSLSEGKNPVSLFLENEIIKIVERNLPPKITKRELMKYLNESEPAVAPTKPAPTTKPDTKPNTRPSHPGKNPNPGTNPAPKANKPSPEEAKDKVMDVIMKLLNNQ